MANLFAHLHMEDRTADFPEGALITEGDEGESVAAAIAEATEEEAGVVEAENEMDDLVEGEETASDLVDAVEEAPKTESAGLTTTNARLLSKVLKHLGGAATAKSLMPKMEHFDGRASRRDATQLVMEGIQDSLKNFWEALKRQFQKVWAKLKSWYVKTFSASKRIAARAEGIRTRAEGMSSTIDKKSFQFGQVKLLSIQGKLKDYNAFKAALNTLTSIVETSCEAPTEKMIDDVDKVVDNAFDAGGNDKTATNKERILNITAIFESKYTAVLKGSPQDIPESEKKLLESLGGGNSGTNDVKVSDLLPGDKLVAIVQGKESTTDVLAPLRNTRIRVIDSKYKPKEVSGDAEAITLSTSQIADLCNIISESANVIFDFDKEWQKVDRVQTAFLRRLDEVMKDMESDVKDNDDHTGKNLRDQRTLAKVTTDFVKAAAGIPGQMASLAMPIYGATLNWCEGSMRNYKK